MEKIKLMLKVFIYINALFFMTFYLLPSSKVFAGFTDSASLNAGIKLTLGNLDLSSEQNETTTGLTYLGGSPVLLSSRILENKGTLNGKLAYKIQVTEKGTGTLVNDNEMQIIMNFDFASGNKLITTSKINSADYTFVTDNENNEWIFDVDQEKDTLVTIKYKTNTVPKNDSDIDITVTFLLVQTNASEPKETMFYDEISFKHELKLKAEEVPDPTDPNYWPAADDKNWKLNGEVKYYDAQFENIMYFSELESDDRILRNLDDNVLYIELPEGMLKKDNNFSINKPEGYQIKAEVMENRRFIKLTFSLDVTKGNNNKLTSKIGYYQVGFNYIGGKNANVYFSSDLLPLVHKRILLNTDEKIQGKFEPLPIYTTLEQKRITFKYTNLKDSWNGDNQLNYSLVDASLSYKNLYAEIVKEPKLFDLSLHKADQKDNLDYLLINTSKVVGSANMNKKGKLKIIIVGNNGNRLVIYRDLSITEEVNFTPQSRMIIQSEASSEIEEVQTELQEEVVKVPVITKEAVKQNESLQDSTSEETATEDNSATVIIEEAVEEKESALLDESLQESSASDAKVE